MPKYMFKHRENNWFSYLAFLTSLALLSAMIFLYYLNLTEHSRFDLLHIVSIYTYFKYGLLGILCVLCLSAWFDIQRLSPSPLFITLFLLILWFASFVLNRRAANFDLTDALFFYIIFNLVSLCLLWWLSAHSSPAKLSFSYNKNKILRSFAWLGAITLLAQIVLGDWLHLHHLSLNCIHFPFCNTQVIRFYDIAGVLDFWQAGHIREVDHLLFLPMLHRSFVIFNLGYFLLLGLWLLKRDNLRSIGFYCLVLTGMQFYLCVASVKTLTIAMLATAHYAIALLMLLTTLSLLSRLYVKYQSTW